jgi:hypothetical protein
MIKEWSIAPATIGTSRRCRAGSVYRDLRLSDAGVLASVDLASHGEASEINLDETMGGLGVEDTELSLTLEEKTAAGRDLLEPRSGVYHAALDETAEMATRRSPRFSHKPGTF